MTQRMIRLMLLKLCVGLVAASLLSCNPQPRSAIRIGVIHSLTGTMAMSEAPLADAVRLAVEEINAGGGLLGRPLEMRLVDSRSDPRLAAAEAERLIVDEGVSALFGCWTSECRKALKPVVEKHNHLLFYPVQYEGLEQSPNIIYTGSAPNQQIVPGAYWAMQHLGKRVYLIGSDYVFPRMANRIIADLVTAAHSTLLAERYRPLDSADFSQIAQEISQLRPDVVVNTVNGESNRHLFRALRAAGLSDQTVLSFSIAEGELHAMPELRLPNHYAVWNYFQNLEGENNRRFVAAYRNRFGADRPTSDPIEAAYIGVHLWAQAVREGGGEHADLINHLVLRQSIAAPSGILAVDPGSRHLWKSVRIGKANAEGSFDVVYASKWPLRPTPFPLYRTQRAWRELINQSGNAP
ncbi:urea ABC transporter substrate-binding protein [Methylomonas sp. LL1]|uniref:urea ABC transporter substrate-binding protein n=1 Tax=Methylomonas sp. LL1 TaxID=2785785 RepID=UPI0018C3C70A|nr:urea ABC transporter substrate-binding protein [Methylomonas sp. LL1]QPK61740.1 urea ABC transporter substrate-binding protein [Methylomonas sp. LL1]